VADAARQTTQSLRFAFTPEIFTIDAAAHYLGISKRTVQKYIEQGRLHTYRLPAPADHDGFLQRTLIRKDALDKLISIGSEI